MANGEKNREITFDIKQHFGVFGRDPKGWTRELNLVSWNGAEAKYDIRNWDQDHCKMGRGVTLTTLELSDLKTLLSELDI